MMMNMVRLGDDAYGVELRDTSMSTSWMMNRESILGLAEFLRTKCDELWSQVDVASMSGVMTSPPLESQRGNYTEGGDNR